MHGDRSKAIEGFQDISVEHVPWDRSKLLRDRGLWAHADLLIIEPNTREMSGKELERSRADFFSMQDMILKGAAQHLHGLDGDGPASGSRVD